MEKEYIRNLKAIAGTGYYFILEQNLEILCAKYELTDEECKNMKLYCKDHNITIVHEEKIYTKNTEDTNDMLQSVNNEYLRKRRKEHDKLARTVTETIFTIASNIASKTGHRPIFYCEKFIRLLKDQVAEQVKMVFTFDQLRIITNHLSHSNNDEFVLQEIDNALVINRKMNNLIKKIYSELYQ